MHSLSPGIYWSFRKKYTTESSVLLNSLKLKSRRVSLLTQSEHQYWLVEELRGRRRDEPEQREAPPAAGVGTGLRVCVGKERETARTLRAGQRPSEVRTRKAALGVDRSGLPA